MKEAEYFASLHIKLDTNGLTGAEIDQLCCVLRGLFYSNGQSDGQTTKNNQFRAGTTVRFGAAPMAKEFIKSVRRFLKSSVIKRIELTLGP